MKRFQYRGTKEKRVMTGSWWKKEQEDDPMDTIV